MLRIRKEQNDLLSEYMLRRFEARMVAQLRSTFPEQTKDTTDADLRAMIRAGVDEAAEYDVTDEADVERYLECMVAHGPDFDTNPKTFWAGSILRDETLTGTQKMDQINGHELFVLTGDE